MHYFQIRLVCCAAALLVLSGTPETARSAPDGQRAAAPPGHGAAPAVAEPGAQAAVLARFTGGQVSVADLQAAIANKDAITRARFTSIEERKRFLEQLVRHDLLVLEAERRGFARHPAVIDAGKRAAIDAMRTRDLTVDPASIPAADVKAHFEAHRDDHARPAMRRASHIELATEPEARALIAQLKGSTREAFAKVAVERSRDARTRRQGGELGYFDRDGKPRAKRAARVVPPELAGAAFALTREGQLSTQPVAHGSAFSVLMLTGEMDALVPRFAELQPILRAELAEQRGKQAEEALVAALREQVAPELHPELLSAITLDGARLLDQPQGYPAAPPDPRAPTKVVEPDGF